MKKFLGKLGRGILKGLPIADKIAGEVIPFYVPILSRFIPGQKDDRILGAVQTIGERIHSELQHIGALAVGVEITSQTLASPLTGEQKLAALVPQIRPLIEAALGVVHKNGIADDTLFDLGVQKIASGVVDCINAKNAKDLPDVD